MLSASLRASLLLAFAPALASGCTAAEVCASASDYTPSAHAGNVCCEDSGCTSFNWSELDSTCTGCTGTPYSTQGTCEGAGKFWLSSRCSDTAPGWANFCNQMQPTVTNLGNDCCNGGAAAPSSPAVCTDADICSTASDYTPAAHMGSACCNDGVCNTWNYNELDTGENNGGCTTCTGTRYDTQATCEGAGLVWASNPCSTGATSFGGNCNLIETLANRFGNTCCSSASFTPAAPPSPAGPPSVLTGSDDPCFPSSAMVTMADGRLSRVDALQEGDKIVAATADGALTTDSVSLLSLAMREVPASAFVVLTTNATKTLTLTGEHHLPVGASCCSSLKKAKDVAVGDLVWAAGAGAKAIAQTVTAISATKAAGLHSPVLSSGSFPVVDGIVTSFDSFEKVTLAKYGLAPLLAACKASGTCGTFREMFLGDDKKYIA